MEYHGEFVDQPRVELHPAPLQVVQGPHLLGHRLARVGRDHGQARHRRADRAPEAVAPGAGGDRDLPRRRTGRPSARSRRAPIVAGWTFVDENADRAEEQARTWLAGYWDSVIAHYEFDKPHLKSTPGYEFHGLMYDRLTAPGRHREDDRLLHRPAAVRARPSRSTRRSSRSATWSAPTASSACSATAACRSRRPSAACGCSPREVMPELQALAPATDRLDHVRA